MGSGGRLRHAPKGQNNTAQGKRATRAPPWEPSPSNALPCKGSQNAGAIVRGSPEPQPIWMVCLCLPSVLRQETGAVLRPTRAPKCTAALGGSLRTWSARRNSQRAGPYYPFRVISVVVKKVPGWRSRCSLTLG